MKKDFTSFAKSKLLIDTQIKKVITAEFISIQERLNQQPRLKKFLQSRGLV